MDPLHPMPPPFEDWVATKIQSTYRGYRCRQQLAKETQAANLIQNAWRTREPPVKEKEPLTFAGAASKIQRAWRSFSCVKIYHYYRDMIHFRERGDPAQLMRAINPREAQLLDAATGTHLRFRLGGTTFPPLIYYKIFTHRPVTDMCSFSPKDYTQEVHLGPKNLHSHEIPGVQEFLDRSNQANWYMRIDNNGWRPLSEHVLVDVDPVTQMSAAKRRPFHHVPLVRREEAILRKKQRQREWMMKMYARGRGGGMGAPDDMDGDEFDAHAASLLNTLATTGDEDLSEEDRDLLRWTAALDFQSYQQDWVSLATSQYSEALVPISNDYFDQFVDLPEIPIDGYAPDYSSIKPQGWALAAQGE